MLSWVRPLLLPAPCHFLTLFCPTDPHSKLIHVKIVTSHLISNTLIIASYYLHLERVQVHSSSTESSQMPPSPSPALKIVSWCIYTTPSSID